jgi:hypothetical protein
MCGIVGMACKWSNGFTHMEMDVFETMLFLDTLRGWDSTGVFGVDNIGNVQLHKEAVHGPDFLCTKEYKEFAKEALRRGRFLVGHNRAATKGAVNDKNAHPFCVDDKVILVQNGTYNGDHTKLAKTEVDTEAIAITLANEPDIAAALKKVNAAYALSWYDTRNESMHLLRNTQRPLFVAETNSGTIIWASEGNTILYAAARHNVELKEKPKMLPEYELMQMKLEKGGSFVTEQNKIDCHFRYEYVQSQEGHIRHPYACAWENDPDADGDWRGGHMGMGGRHDFHPANAGTMQQQHAKGVRQAHKVESNSFLAEYRKYSKPVRFEEDDVTRLVNFFKRDEELIIETDEYFFGNDERDCEVFFITGTPLVTESPTELLPPCYFVVKDITEEQALNMAAHRFIKVKISNFISSNAGYTPNPDLKVVGVKCQFIEDCSTQEEVANVQ